MDKVKLLQERAAAFRDLLKQHEARNADAMLLLKLLTPLFQEIEAGKIVPPKYYEFGNALGKDAPFYAPDMPFHAVEAEFVSALEDWKSQSWYQQMFKNK
ncbi:MAG: hypothetical protein WAW02_02440 [Sideroxyarcus sp.]